MAEGEELYRQVLTNAQDVRVLHYCVRTRNFDKAKIMGDDEKIRNFCGLEGLAGGELILQNALRQFLGGWRVG